MQCTGKYFCNVYKRSMDLTSYIVTCLIKMHESHNVRKRMLRSSSFNMLQGDIFKGWMGNIDSAGKPCRLGNLHQGHSTSKALYKGENWDTETQSKLPKSPSKAEQEIRSADGQEHCLHQCWTKIQTQQLCTLVLRIYLAELFFNTALTSTSRSVPHIWVVGKGSQKDCSSEQGPQRNLCPHKSSGIFQEDVGELKYQVLKSLS